MTDCGRPAGAQPARRSHAVQPRCLRSHSRPAATSPDNCWPPRVRSPVQMMISVHAGRSSLTAFNVAVTRLGLCPLFFAVPGADVPVGVGLEPLHDVALVGEAAAPLPARPGLSEARIAPVGDGSRDMLERQPRIEPGISSIGSAVTRGSGDWRCRAHAPSNGYGLRSRHHPGLRGRVTASRYISGSTPAMLVSTFRTREGGGIHVGLAIAWDLTLCSSVA